MRTIVPIALSPTLISLTLIALANHSYAAHHHRQRARLYPCIPPYGYPEDHPRPGDRAIAAADGVDEVDWLKERPKAEAATGDPVEKVRRKKFHFPQKSLSVDHVTLDQVGLAIYDTGDVSCTGRVTHDGGPDGDLRSHCVVIRLRAYAAPAATSLLDAPVVWQSEEQRVRVIRDRPVTVSLVAVTQDSQLRRHFRQITHLEVELQYQQDR